MRARWVRVCVCACVGVRARACACACACVRVRVRACVYMYIGKDSAAPAHARTRIHAHTGPRRHARASARARARARVCVMVCVCVSACGKDGGVGWGRVCCICQRVFQYILCLRVCAGCVRFVAPVHVCPHTSSLSSYCIRYTCTSYRSINFNILKKKKIVKVLVFFFL